MSWLDYLKEFWLLLPVVFFAAPALFVAGSQALAQSKTLDIFILVQGTVIGHLVALSAGVGGAGELLLCYLFAAIALGISHFVEKTATVYQSSLRIAFYAFLLVSVYIFERWVPGLEKHINTAFVGDLLFLNKLDIGVLIGIVLLYLFYSLSTFDSHIRRFFNRRVLKISQKAPPLWLALNFLVLVSGTHFLGLSFVLGFAVIVPLCFSLMLSDGTQKIFFVLGALISAMASVVALMSSFAFPEQSTSPFVVILSLVLIVLILFGRKYVKKI